MSMLLLQTFLLMLTAFFLGALVACLIKSTFFETAQDSAADLAVPRDMALAQGQAQMQPRSQSPAVVSPALAPAAAPRPAPEPVRPKIETVVRPAATIPAAAPEAERFERALNEKTATLTTATSSAVTAPAQAPAPPAPAAKPVVAAPVTPVAPPTNVTQPSSPAVNTPVTIKPAAPFTVAVPVVTPVPAPPTLKVGVPVAPAAPVAPPAGPVMTPVAPAKPVVQSPAPAPAPAPSPATTSAASPAAPAGPTAAQIQQSATSAVGIGAAAAAAAAIAATQMRAAPATGDAKPAAAPVAPMAPAPVAPTPVAPAPVMPVASGGTGQSSVTAEVSIKPVAPAPIAPALIAAAAIPAAATPPVAAPVVATPVKAPLPAEDLTRIRGVDHTMQARLNGFGIRRYDQIAAWNAADVARVGTALGIGGRIQQENWIEQAQVLAKGGVTDFMRKQAGAGLAEATPSANEGQPIKPAQVTAAPSAMPAAAPAAPAAAPTGMAGPINTPASATTPGTFTSVPFGQMVRPTAQPEPASTPPPAPATMELPRTGAQAAAAAAAAIAAAAAASNRRSGAPAAAAEMRDDLQRIAGVDSEVEKLLNVQGVTRFSQIASWNAADTDRFTRLLGAPGRIGRENWIEQAAVLAGVGAAYTRRDDVQAKPDADATRPARLADAIRERETGAKPAAADRSQPRTDLSNLRSVRSEALRGDQPAVAGGVDDLKRIRGIGVLIEKKLNSLGITGYEQVANWTGADVDRVSQILDFKGRIERENWVEQARILASGGQTEFSRRVDKGDA